MLSTPGGVCKAGRGDVLMSCAYGYGARVAGNATAGSPTYDQKRGESTRPEWKRILKMTGRFLTRLSNLSVRSCTLGSPPGRKSLIGSICRILVKAPLVTFASLCHPNCAHGHELSLSFLYYWQRFGTLQISTNVKSHLQIGSI